MHEWSGIQPAPEDQRVPAKVNRFPNCGFMDWHVKVDGLEVDMCRKVGQNNVRRILAQAMGDLKQRKATDCSCGTDMKIVAAEQHITLKESQVNVHGLSLDAQPPNRRSRGSVIRLARPPMEWSAPLIRLELMQA